MNSGTKQYNAYVPKLRKLVLKRRELIALLEHNGFVVDKRVGSSHIRYRGNVDGQEKCVDVDESIDDFAPRSFQPLYYIVSSQLGFFGEVNNLPAKVGWERFYAGHPDTARKANVPYKAWND